jgi:hypothetical protein
MASVSLVEIERLLVRQRMILERLLIHFEGLRPGTDASAEAALHITHAAETIRSLEKEQRALRYQAEERSPGGSAPLCSTPKIRPTPRPANLLRAS